MAETAHVLARRNPNAADLAGTSLRQAGVRRRVMTPRKDIETILGMPPAELVLHPPDFLAVLEDDCMLTDGRRGFMFAPCEAVTLELPKRWSPVLRAGELATTTMHC